MRTRIASLNAQLAAVCATYSLRRFDRGAVFDIPWKERDSSSKDHQHLSVAGQRTLAAATWRATFPFGR